MKDWRIEIRISNITDGRGGDLYKTEIRVISIYERHSVYENSIMYRNELIGEKNDRMESRTHRWSLPYFTNEKDKKNKNKFYLLIK